MIGLRNTKGFRKAYPPIREHDEVVDIKVHTLWDSLDVIRAFAKEDLHAGVVEPQAEEALTTCDKAVTHFITQESEA